jgi:hypothetical protein
MSLARLAALRAEEPGDGNPEQVEQDHRHGKHRHRGDVSRRRQDRGQDRDDQHRGTEVAHQEPRRHEADPGEKKDHNGKLEDEAHAEDDPTLETERRAERDLRLEPLPQVEQPAGRRRRRHRVSEPASAEYLEASDTT